MDNNRPQNLQAKSTLAKLKAAFADFKKQADETTKIMTRTRRAFEETDEALDEVIESVEAQG